MRFLIGLTFLISLGCSVHRQSKQPMPYLNSIEESKAFSDSLRTNGIDKILVYHKKHGMSLRNYYIFWIDNELQLRKINEHGIFKPNSWEVIGYYRDDRLFEFFQKNQRKLNQDTIPELNWSHYPYSDIQMAYNDSVTDFHLPDGIHSSENSSPYQFARLIESTLFNIEQGTYWQQAEKKMKFFPKKYDPTKEKWQNWRSDKIREGVIWDDYYH